MIGKRFGSLTVVRDHSTTRNGHKRFTCVCDCGNTCNILGTHLQQGNTTSCGCMRPRGKDHPKWTGFGDISGNYWHNHVIRSASGAKGRRKIDVNITIEYAWDLFLKQKGRCALSGRKLRFPERHTDRGWTASLDRINSLKGYVEGNVQWVHKDVNIMKNKFDNNYFIDMCKEIANNNKIK